MAGRVPDGAVLSREALVTSLGEARAVAEAARSGAAAAGASAADANARAAALGTELAASAAGAREARAAAAEARAELTVTLERLARIEGGASTSATATAAAERAWGFARVNCRGAHCLRAPPSPPPPPPLFPLSHELTRRAPHTTRVAAMRFFAGAAASASARLGAAEAEVSSLKSELAAVSAALGASRGEGTELRKRLHAASEDAALLRSAAGEAVRFLRRAGRGGGEGVRRARSTNAPPLHANPANPPFSNTKPGIPPVF